MNYYSSYRADIKPKKPKGRRKLVSLTIVTVIIIAMVGWFAFGRDKKTDESHAATNQVTKSEAGTSAPVQAALPDLQPVVDKWVGSHNGSYSIVILDENGKTIAEHDPNEQMFTASLYKIYVAYVGYQKIADGTYSADQPYLSGYTRGECLDAMIRSSYSPCGEKMWAELGKESVTAKLKTYGATGTSMTGLVTTAHDSALVLQRLLAQKDLKDPYAAQYLDSMKTQDAKFRRGLPSGFSNSTVYNKVGWNEDVEWHDAAIVKTNNGKTIVAAVLSKNAGYANIANLGSTLEKALQ